MNKTISALILSILIGSIIFGMIEMVNGAENKSSCKNLYWIDNENKACGQKQFCGMYMYYGLQTFESKTQCENAVNETKDKSAKTCPESSDLENNSCYKLLSNGKKAEIKIMPSTASERAIERLGQLNFTIELKEVGTNKTAYELTGKKQGKFLGIFKIMASEKVQVDAESGEVVKVIKPWWSFLEMRI